jgi:hypothetical protein
MKHAKKQTDIMRRVDVREEDRRDIKLLETRRIEDRIVLCISHATQDSERNTDERAWIAADR